MENRRRSSHEYESVEQRELAGDDVLLTICENSVESQEFLSSGGGRNDLPNVLEYRLIDKTKNGCDETKSGSDYLKKSTIPVQLNNDCDFFVIKEYSNDTHVAALNQTVRNVPRPIAPKLSDMNYINSTKRSFVIESYKKRDDKRRATHNEVERRRRDKINSWIFKLKELIPESAAINSPTDLKCKANAADSKSQILIRACEYIKEMQEELQSLRQCLMENDRLRLNNQQMQLQMDQLKTSTSARTDKSIKYETLIEEKKD